MDLVLNFVVPVANVSQWGIIAEYCGFFSCDQTALYLQNLEIQGMISLVPKDKIQFVIDFFTVQ